MASGSAWRLAHSRQRRAGITVSSTTEQRSQTITWAELMPSRCGGDSSHFGSGPDPLIASCDARRVVHLVIWRASELPRERLQTRVDSRGQSEEQGPFKAEAEIDHVIAGHDEVRDGKAPRVVTRPPLNRYEGGVEQRRRISRRGLKAGQDPRPLVDASQVRSGYPWRS